MGVSVSTPISWSHSRRTKLSPIPTSWPFAERYSAVGQPQYPSPPRTRTLTAPSTPGQPAGQVSLESSRISREVPLYSQDPLGSPADPDFAGVEPCAPRAVGSWHDLPPRLAAPARGVPGTRRRRGGG